MEKYFRLSILYFLLIISSCSIDNPKEEQNIVNDVSQLNPIKVQRVVVPTTNSEIIGVVKNQKGTISIGGGRFSMGGQTATENTIQIDMRKFNRIISFSKEQKEITVQAGIRWRELIQFIDKYDLSVKIMQTYANFTVGGSLSVNVHGRYVGQGPIILSVKSIKILLANGDLIAASPFQNQEIFYAAIGGYGGIGVITEVTLSLTENCKVERKDTVMKISGYNHFFSNTIKNNSDVIFHNADIYPRDFDEIRAISYMKTDKELTIKDRLKPNDGSYVMNRFAIKTVSNSCFGKWLRKDVINPLYYSGNVVEWRNYEATYDVAELEPSSREKSTYVLQEYFVPIAQFGSFYPKMIRVLKENKVNVMNISIRHANRDPGSQMAWAKAEVFAFVIYYKQGVLDADKEKVKIWTGQLIDASIVEKGSYYLPYQIYARKEQFLKAYPNALEFFKLKKKYDPEYKFRNKLFDAYYN
ncbi:FAD-binding oxidoreductase [Pedobacter frigiditerrae]|uniref:FAD-binding oxidoreductase n=1 Tax=Pedobacter frigiditerrae TaxID=2530452 RepID=A0A4R0N5E2_9SPHI|nr:FAD-binding oxidoreductase [Pedobacter frigiditerrae]TCC93474.1 FAD-binding oxidoreductase [Pedobacter frigiditerrae]